MTQRLCPEVSETDEAALLAIANDVRPDWTDAPRPDNRTTDIETFAERALSGRWKGPLTQGLRKCFLFQCLLLDEELTAYHETLREMVPRIRKRCRRGLTSVEYWEVLRSEIEVVCGEQPTSPLHVQRVIAALNMYVLLGS